MSSLLRTQGYTQHGGEVQTTRPPAVQSQGSGRFEQVEFLRGGDTDLSPQQLMDAATGWAKRNGFSTEQLQEFGHLITVLTFPLPRGCLLSTCICHFISGWMRALTLAWLLLPAA